MSVEGEIVLARETIPKGSVIRLDQIITTRKPQFPALDSSGGMPFVVAGKVARRTLWSGQEIAAEALDAFRDVLRGETVHVRAVAGGVIVRFDAVAQSSGQKGEIIMVHNPASGRTFQGLIEGREQVVVRGNL